jgi:hypothetical protein
VKFNKINSIVPILLLAFFSAFGNNATSIPEVYNSLNARDFDYLQANQNTNAIFFKEISSIVLFQIEPENNSGNSDCDLGKNSSSLIINCVQENSNSWTYLQDIRDLLEHQIFPFHFFW